ncbi:unnamed protein product [Schistosoma mattheei]|uniref:Uncharacterized protein n=1 Tax=Schistosoma mattheei TaxID=31246 RepID=A0A183PXD2_9TREM|nr:unnamed protein product [Schistosoma mattheei]
MRQLYDMTKKLVGEYSKPERQVKNKNDKPVAEIQGERNKWIEHFEELLNRPIPLSPMDIEAEHTDLPEAVTPPTIEEIRMTTRQIKSGKAEGPDNIPAETLKSDTEVTAKMLHVQFRRKDGCQ